MTARAHGCVVVYAHGRMSHAEASAQEIRSSCPGARVILASDECHSGAPGWADFCVRPEELKRFIAHEGFGRPSALVLVVSNEPRYTSLVGVARATFNSISVFPESFRVHLYAWSGRYGPGEAFGEVMAKLAGRLARPFLLASYRLAHALGELIFPLINGKPRDAAFNPDSVKRVLVVSLDLIGDMVWLAPAVSGLSKAMPQARIDMLVSSSNTELAGMIAGVDRVLNYDAPWFDKLRSPRGAPAKRVSRYANLAARLGLLSSGYDLALDFRGEPRDFPLMYMTGAPYRAAFIGGPSGAVTARDVSYLLTHAYELSDDAAKRVHIADRHIGMLGSLGLQAGVPANWLTPGADMDDAARRMLTKAGVRAGDKVVGIQPGASRPEKRWSPDGFALVARALMASGARVLLLGSKEEDALCGGIAGNAPGAVNLCGRTGLGELVSLVKACDLIISNETSAISISSAVGTPIVCLMTGVPEMYGPYGAGSAVLQKKPECYEPVGEHCFCPFGYRCLQEITPDEVVREAAALLGSAAPD